MRVREREKNSFRAAELPPDRTKKKKSVMLYSSTYNILYKGVVKINTHTVSVLKSNGPFRGEMRFSSKVIGYLFLARFGTTR